MRVDRLQFDHSLKNIPLHSNKAVLTSTLEEAELLIKRMRWRAFWYDRRDEETESNPSEHYGFSTFNTPPAHLLLKNFEEDLFKLVKGMTFKKVKNEFLSSLGKFRNDVKKCDDIIVKVDKTRNIYTLKKQDYNQLLNNNITMDYRKTDDSHIMDINKETQQHAIDLRLEDRMEKLTERKAFISIKDYKANFPNNIQCRLINPARNNLGKVTQQIIRNAVSSVKEQTKLNLWMGTNEVLKWYEATKKQGAQFILYDIEAYYPSISEQLWNLQTDITRSKKTRRT